MPVPVIVCETAGVFADPVDCIAAGALAVVAEGGADGGTIAVAFGFACGIAAVGAGCAAAGPELSIAALEFAKCVHAR